MFDGTDICWIPDTPTAKQSEQRLKIAQFGDGYQQRTLDGINALNLKWSLTWENRKESEIKAMDSYLAACQGAPFRFRDPLTQVLYWVFCDLWQTELSVERKRSNFTERWGTLSAEFVKANGVFVP